MTGEAPHTVDIPEPEVALAGEPDDLAAVDPGGDAPPEPSEPPPLGEDPAYDPGGMGRQPDAAEEHQEG